ncbi:sigma-70 family RNA polymerase sigma factor [Planotetraspora sp. GP83]|uniref:sigma-70 family RNA polymerase sigma factor n=1 Tax=Planotetraspora sp. GP83 TaxID=3156264 RepID=UPI003513C365
MVEAGGVPGLDGSPDGARLPDDARGGGEAAFESLVERHRGELYAHCYRMLGSVQDAEDAVQESLLAAWRGLSAFEGRSSLRTWLYRVATNACLRLSSRRPRRMLSPEYGPARSDTRDLGKPVTGPVWVEPWPDDLPDDLAAPLRHPPPGRLGQRPPPLRGAQPRRMRPEGQGPYEPGSGRGSEVAELAERFRPEVRVAGLVLERGVDGGVHDAGESLVRLVVTDADLPPLYAVVPVLLFGFDAR